jgi:maltose alpha-D-glucosyltransferase/alpha-amylase
MAFHFPLMPRVFLALERGEAHPIVDIVRATDRLPGPSCQWALFLRSHDELTLSAVTPAERALLFDAYAPEPRMRLNNGIRRRLAPLLGNDRARIELAHALLLSLPGTPVLYYGDEIGMGDNVQLDDREGLRMPMPWDEAAAQRHDSTSLQAAVAHLVSVRRQHRAFGRGSIEFLDTGNRCVLAFTRRFEDDAILVVANLAGTTQPACIEVAAMASVIDLVHGVERPLGALEPNVFTLPPHAWRWFELAASGVSAVR